MKEFLKKSWFVILVGAILVGVAGFMAWDMLSQQLPSKQVDGKDVVFSYDECTICYMINTDLTPF